MPLGREAAALVPHPRPPPDEAVALGLPAEQRHEQVGCQAQPVRDQRTGTACQAYKAFLKWTSSCELAPSKLPTRTSAPAK